MAKYTPMMEQYLALKATVPDALLFFRLGDFYELFFEDAANASRLLEITLTGREAGQADRVPMCGVPYHAAEGYISRLIDLGCKVAIAEQMENPSDAKGVVKRDIVRMITPGTVLEARSLTDTRNNFIAAIVKESDGTSSAVVADWSTGELHIIDERNWIGCKDAIMIYRPREVIADVELLDLLCDETALGTNGWTPTVWTTEQAWESEPLASMLLGMSVAVKRSAARLQAYFWHTQKQPATHMQRVHVHVPGGRLMLDPLTRRSLELTETVREKEKKGSLLWLMDETRTSMGARLMRQWLEQPLCDLPAIELRQEAVEQLTDAWMVRETIRESLKEIYDLERLLARVSVGSANGRDLIALQKSLEQIPGLCEAAISSGSRTLTDSVKPLDRCQDVCQDIKATLVEDPPISLRDGGFIRDGVDEQLDLWRAASRGGKQWMAELEQSERERTGIKSLKVGYNKVFGYYIEVTKSNIGAIPEGLYERKQTLSTGERYVTPKLKEQEALILQAEEKLSGREFELFQSLRLRVAAQLTRLHHVAYWVATLDVFQGLSTVAVTNRWVKPDFHQNFELSITHGRHPVVESVLNDQTFITNDANLESDHPMMLITGPNMAGKSTYMRQIALICILGQMGSFVPATSAKLPLIDRIFTRIGAADDLVAGQSTFMTEMMDIRVMTEKATKRSLVIIDELGRGTSTNEGMAIAQAVIEHIHDTIGCKTLVSTHFHELAELEATLSGLLNYAMAVQERDQQVTFLRKLSRGAATSSYGVYCAKLAGLPERIIGRAEQLLEHTESVLHAAGTPFAPIAFGTAPAPEPIDVMVRDPKLEALMKEIAELNILHLTPVQALTWIDKWQRDLKQSELLQKEA